MNTIPFNNCTANLLKIDYSLIIHQLDSCGIFAYKIIDKKHRIKIDKEFPFTKFFKSTQSTEKEKRPVVEVPLPSLARPTTPLSRRKHSSHTQENNRWLPLSLPRTDTRFQNGQHTPLFLAPVDDDDGGQYSDPIQFYFSSG